MSTRVRLGTSADWRGLAALRWQSRSEAERAAESHGAFSARFAAWLEDALQQGSWTIAIVDSEGAEPVGCMYLQRVATVPVPGVDARAWGYVTHAFVLPAWRRQGAARRMLDLLVGAARRQGMHELHVWPDVNAVGLYAGAGFLDAKGQVQSGEQVPSMLLPLR